MGRPCDGDNLPFVLKCLGQRVPGCSPATLPKQIALFDELTQLLFERVSAGAREFDDVAHAHTAMLTGVIQNSHRQFRQGRKDQFLTLNLGGQPLHLLLQGAQEEDQHGCQFGAPLRIEPWVCLRAR